MGEVAPLLIAGLGVGFLIGLTGVGGGSLMTPLLVLVFGHAPGAAVGTDLFFACGTKSVGVAVHQRAQSVNWAVVRRLAAGSLPTSAFMLWLLWATGASATRNGLIMTLLGTLIAFTGARSLGLPGLRRRRQPAIRDPGELHPMLTVASGALLGGLVTLTSIGAGAIGVVLLRALYPSSLGSAALIGTDLAHAIPLTLLAGAGYLAMGQVEMTTLGWLLAGSIPGVIAGSLLPARLEERTVQRVMGMLLLIVGAKTLASAISFT